MNATCNSEKNGCNGSGLIMPPTESNAAQP